MITVHLKRPITLEVYRVSSSELPEEKYMIRTSAVRGDEISDQQGIEMTMLWAQRKWGVGGVDWAEVTGSKNLKIHPDNIDAIEEDDQ